MDSPAPIPTTIRWNAPPAVTLPLKIITCSLVILGLYLGRTILVPLALAALFSLVLAPAASALQRRRVPRTVSVAAVVGLALTAVMGASLMVSSQVMQLSHDLPRFQDQVHRKLSELRQQVGATNALGGVSRLIVVVEREVDATRQAISPVTAVPVRAPQPVTVVGETRPPWQAARDFLMPLLEPLLTTGIAIVLVFFILLDRQDLRDRLIHLTGADIHTMSAALDEAAQRVSRYLATQVMVNLGFGLHMALGLWLIGVPGALVWGALAAVLRFVPYLGTLVAAACPLAMAMAVDTGWSMLGWTLVLLLGLELVFNNLVEPMVYGSSTGLGMVALLVSAAFWTALWGPVGLVLATPITVCLVTLGRHLPSLGFLESLLGSKPVLDPPTRLYHRLLSGHEDDAFEQAVQDLRQRSLAQVYDDVVAPAMLLGEGLGPARSTRAQHRQRVSAGLRHLVRDLGQRCMPDTPHLTVVAQPPRIVCHGLRREADELGAEMLAQVLNQQALATRRLALGAAGGSRLRGLDTRQADLLCLSSVQRPSAALIRLACRRLRAERPQLKIVLLLWALPSAELAAGGTLGPDTWQDLGVDGIANSIGATVQLARAALQIPPREPRDRVRTTTVTSEPDTTDGMAAARRAAEVFGTRQALVAWADGRIDAWPLQADGSTRALLQHLLNTAPAEPWVVPDLRRDTSMPAGLCVRSDWRFVAGATVRDAQDRTLGQLLILDPEVRGFDASDRQVLAAQARHLAAQRVLMERLSQMPTPPARDLPALRPLGA